MNDAQPLELTVECYAGRRGEQEPRRVHFSGRAVAVAEIPDRCLASDHRYFKLRGIVRHNERRGMWELSLFLHAQCPAPETGGAAAR